MTGFPFPLDRNELLRLKAIADRTVERRLTEEFEPSLLEIDRARERRNPNYFYGTYHQLQFSTVAAWGLGEVDAALESLQLMPEMLGEALEYGWRPVASEAQTAISFASMAGQKKLVADLVAADRGTGQMGKKEGEYDKLDNPVSWWNRCVGYLVAGDDERARSQIIIAEDNKESLEDPFDGPILLAWYTMLLAIVDNDEDTLDTAARAQTDRLCGILASLREPEHSEELIDAPTTAMLTVAMRRGMAVPRDLPTVPMILVADEWKD